MKKKIMVIIAALFVITAAVATVGAAGRGKVGNPSAAVSGICDGVPAQDGTGMQYGKNENAGQGNGTGDCIYDGECPNDGVPAQDGTGMQYGKNENAGQGNGAGDCIYDGDCPNDGVPAQDGTGMQYGKNQNGGNGKGNRG
ncbi:MAG: hypothetical protein UIM27_09260 [Acutalibacteraceae bacterium]|nr:hypothetical protein [Acutalibacteraceae bacterium]